MKGFLGKKFARNTNFAVLVAVIVVVFVLFNLMLELFPWNIDTTAEKIYSLTPVTEKVLDELEGDVTVYALYDRIDGEADTYKAQVVKVLDFYDSYAKVNVEYIDLDRKPSFLRETVGEMNASLYAEGDYIVKHGENIRRIASKDVTVTEVYQSYYEITTGIQIETKLTSAILKVFSDVPVIYYSTGFGENTRSNYSTLLSYIDASGFDVQEIDLKAEEPAHDAAAIMFFGPQTDLTDEAAYKLSTWLETGKDAFFFMDIRSLKDNSNIDDGFEKFSEVLAPYGILLGNSIVEESEEYAQQSKNDKIFVTSTVTAGALEDLPNTKMYITNTRNLDIDTMVDGATPEAFLETSKDASSTSIIDGSTRTGKHIVGVSSTYEFGRGVSQVAVFGSSHNLSDTSLMYWGTTPQTVLRQIMTWMDIEVAENVGDSIEAKTYNNVTSRVDVTETEIKVWASIVMIAIPLVILAAGFIVWIRRRHL